MSGFWKAKRRSLVLREVACAVGHSEALPERQGQARMGAAECSSVLTPRERGPVWVTPPPRPPFILEAWGPAQRFIQKMS